MRGFNARLDSLQAAVLRVKLRHLDVWNDARRRHAAGYRASLAGCGATLPSEEQTARSVWHLYVIRVAHRAELQSVLAGLGISTGIHYPTPLHLQPAYEDLGYARGDFPVTEHYAGEILSLPMYAELPRAAIDTIAEAVTALDARIGLTPRAPSVGQAA